MRVIGAAIEVHRHLGPGLLESSYHMCMCRELELQGIAYHSQVTLPLKYKGKLIAKGYIISTASDECCADLAAPCCLRVFRVSVVNRRAHLLNQLNAIRTLSESPRDPETAADSKF